MKSKLKQQSYLVSGAVLAVAVGYLMLVFLPGMRSIRRTRAEIRQKQDFVAETEKKRPQIAELQALQKSISDATAIQRDRLIAPDAVSHLFSKISTLTKVTGTRTTRFQPHDEVRYDSFQQIPIELGVEGNTAAVAELIRQIESLPNLIWINGLKMNTTGEAAGLTRCELELAVFVDNREISD